MINKKNILKYLTEGALIIFSILIAFSLENWRQSKAAEKKQKSILKEIKNELVSDVILLEKLIDNTNKLQVNLQSAIRIIEKKETQKFDSLIYYLYAVESAYESSANLRDNPELMLQKVEHIKRNDISVLLRNYYKFYRGKMSYLVENYQQKRYELLSQFINEHYDRSLDLFPEPATRSIKVIKNQNQQKEAGINKNKFFSRKLLNNIIYLQKDYIYVPWIEDGKNLAKKIADKITNK